MSSEWKPRRFWKSVSVVETPEGFAVELDARRVRTPGKALLALPSRAMAQEVAAEWDAQEGLVDPRTMPFTRSANSAIDKVAAQQREVADLLAAYGDSDLLCYRAEAPTELVARQAEAWDAPLDWAAEQFGARLEARAGVMHVAQDKAALERLAGEVHRLDPFRLTGFHDLVSLTGSLVLGLAAAEGWRDPETLWQASRVDETWQREQWGSDEEADAMAEAKREAFLHAKRFFDLSRTDPA